MSDFPVIGYPCFTHRILGSPEGKHCESPGAPGVAKRIACVAWRFWLGALSNKGGRGQRNREEIGAGATYFSRGFAARSHALPPASRANFAATLLLRPARQNRHATQATKRNVWRGVVSPLKAVSLDIECRILPWFYEKRR